jgi:hypothetical protein
MFGCGHDQPVELAVQFVRELAEVLVLRHGGLQLARLGQTAPVGVADGQQVLTDARDRVEMIRPAGAQPDHGEIQPLVGLGRPGGAAVPQNPPPRRRRNGGLEKPTSIERSHDRPSSKSPGRFIGCDLRCHQARPSAPASRSATSIARNVRRAHAIIKDFVGWCGK